MCDIISDVEEHRQQLLEDLETERENRAMAESDLNMTSESLSLSLTLTSTHLLSLSLTHSPTHALSLIHPYLLAHPLTHSLIPSLTHSLTHSFTHSLTDSLIHPLSLSLTHSLIPSPTPSLLSSPPLREAAQLDSGGAERGRGPDIRPQTATTGRAWSRQTGTVATPGSKVTFLPAPSSSPYHLHLSLHGSISFNPSPSLHDNVAAPGLFFVLYPPPSSHFCL